MPFTFKALFTSAASDERLMSFVNVFIYFSVVNDYLHFCRDTATNEKHQTSFDELEDADDDLDI